MQPIIAEAIRWPTVIKELNSVSRSYHTQSANDHLSRSAASIYLSADFMVYLWRLSNFYQNTGGWNNP